MTNARNLSNRGTDFASVKDYGADPTGAADSTAAFQAAQTAASYIWIPPGSYKVNNLAVASGKRFVGAGPLITKIYQVATGNPSFYVTVPNGSANWVDIELSGFTGYGITSATVPFLVLTASGAAGALWRSKFDYECIGGYGALTATSSGTNNIFNCLFKIRGDTFTGTAVSITSGIYNTYELFLTECSGPALVHSGVNDVIDIVCDNQIQDSGLNTHFSRIVIENIVGAALAAGSSAIQLTGTGQTLMNPGVQLPSGSASKVTYAIKPSSLTTIVNPFITSSGGTTLANPFNVNSGFSWTLIGGSSNCTNKMETIYDDSDNTHSLRYVTMIGDVSQLTAQGNTHGGKVVQYSAPAAPFSLTVNGNTDAVTLAPTGVMATAQFNIINGLVDGRVITISTTQTLTAVSWVSTGTTTNLPSTLAANATISFVYRAANTTFYRV